MYNVLKDLAPQTAASIARGLLQKSAGPLISGDFESFAACFHLPQSFATPMGLRILRTREDLRLFFEDLVDFYNLSGAKVINRKLLQADFLGEGSAVCLHENRLIGSQGVLQPPVRFFSIMQKYDQHWAVSYCEYTSSDNLDYCRALMKRREFAL